MASKKKRSALWDTMPKPNKKILEMIQADEFDLEEKSAEQKQHEEAVLKELGPEEGRQMLIEEGMEMLLDRINAYQKYIEEMESWKEKVRSEYVLVRKTATKKEA